MYEELESQEYPSGCTDFTGSARSIIEQGKKCVNLITDEVARRKVDNELVRIEFLVSLCNQQMISAKEVV